MNYLIYCLCSRKRLGVDWLITLMLWGSIFPEIHAQPAIKGQWDPVFNWPNAGIHVHVLPTGKVLFWGRREWTGTTPAEGLDPRNSTPRLWDPQTNKFTVTPQPGFNVFCSGHAFLPDGRLLVAGGHIADGRGEPRATIYDPIANTWTGVADMNRGRWYPSVLTLPDGRAIVASGAVAPNEGNNTLFQLFDSGSWQASVTHNDISLYPRLHITKAGNVFLAGHLLLTQSLNPRSAQWTVVGESAGPQREDGCSVVYDLDKVLIVGGGLPPLRTAQIIDLSQTNPVWQSTSSMAFARRHHNATLLPDGTILVNGGTSGNGDPHPFNDLSKPVFIAELWDPKTGNWTQMAAESVPRMYHSTAVLLPDGRVLSTGGGEYRLPNGNQNSANDTHRNAQIFSPPYLFRGNRPTIDSAPVDVRYGETFQVQTPTPNDISLVSWVRLSSTTHSTNTSQRINFLSFAAQATGLTVSAPTNANICPPGHYMLFIFNGNKVPSVAKIIRIR